MDTPWGTPGYAIAIWYLVYIAHVVGASFDEYTSCGRDARDSRNFRLTPNIPCDLQKDSWCASAGPQYPVDAMKRFVYENQGLMKRMYGDQRHINVMREELVMEYSNTVPSDGYTPPPNPLKRNSARTNSRAWTDSQDKVKKAYLQNEYRDSRDYHLKKKQRLDSNRVRSSVDEDNDNNQQTTDSIPKPKTNKQTSTTPSVSSYSTTSIPPSELPLSEFEILPRDNENFFEVTAFPDDLTTSDSETESDHIKTTKSIDTDYSTSTTQHETYETEGNFPPLDAYEWIDGEENRDGSSYAYIASELHSPLPPERENNRVLTPESFSTYSTLSTDSALDPPEDVVYVDETFNEGGFLSTSATFKLTTIKLEDRIEPVIPMILETEDLKTKISNALGNNVNIQVNTANLRSDISEDNNDEHTIDTTTLLDPLSDRSSPEEDLVLTTIYDRTTEKNINVQENTGHIASPGNARRPGTTFESVSDQIYDLNHNSGHLKNKHKQPNIPKDYMEPPKAEALQSNNNPSNKIPIESYSIHNVSNVESYSSSIHKSPEVNMGNSMKQQFSQQHQYIPKQKYQTTQPPPQYPKGVSACPVKEEWVAPYWANNTRGKVRALLNVYPFEQYVHFEKCTHEHRQMFCRRGCRCEQQYRLHRLLAIDPNNECRGIFSDWFRFPSCCVCKCYDLPLDPFSRRNSRTWNTMDLDDEDFPDDEDFEEDGETENEDYFENQEEVPVSNSPSDSMDVSGWGHGHYRPHTPKAQVRPQKSPRRYPRPPSHIAPPSPNLKPPAPKYKKPVSRRTYSRIDGLSNTMRPPPKSVTIGTVDARTKPYISKVNVKKYERRNRRVLTRAPRDA